MIRKLLLAICIASWSVNAQDASPWLIRDGDMLLLTNGGMQISFKYILLKAPSYQVGLVIGSDTTLGYQQDRFGLIKLGIIIRE